MLIGYRILYMYTNIDINDGNYSDSLTFDWTASSDVEGESITYKIFLPMACLLFHNQDYLLTKFLSHARTFT